VLRKNEESKKKEGLKILPTLSPLSQSTLRKEAFMKKHILVFMIVVVLASFIAGQAETIQQRINFVLDQTKNIP